MCQVLKASRHTTIVARAARTDCRVGRRSPMWPMATPHSIADGTSTTTKYLEGWYEVIESITRNPSTQSAEVRTRTLRRNAAETLNNVEARPSAVSDTHGSNRIVFKTDR